MKRYNNSVTYLPRESDRHDLGVRVPLFEVVLGPISVGLNVVGVSLHSINCFLSHFSCCVSLRSLLWFFDSHVRSPDDHSG
jgi:hypothetical protein